MKRKILPLWGWAVCMLAHAQVVTTIPIFPTQNDTVTIIYDASQGNGQLAGFVPIYAHTGVITNTSPTPTSWMHVQGTWGTADPKVLMTPLGNNLHQIKYHIPTYYNLPPGTIVYKMAFVFRNASGTRVGRNADGSDIFVDVYQPGQFAAKLVKPFGKHLIRQINQVIEIEGASSDFGTLKIKINGTTISQQNNAKTITGTINTNLLGFGKHYITLEASNGTTTVYDSTYFIVQPPVTVQNPPANVKYGINYLNDSSLILCLHAPFKQFVYAVGDWSNWELDPKYFMKRNQNGDVWWVQIDGLTPKQQYRYQYWIDSTLLQVGDVYADLQLDPWNDQYIPPSVYPNLIPYPHGKTSHVVSVLQPGEDPYPWDTTIQYQRPPKERLVIYELLLRDFIHSHNFKSLKDTLPYLKNLGINAVKIMPIMEFEGNESWGYNPMFYFAVDKYYGTKNDFKSFVEECHRNGIAVILDIALNHSFGQNPQVRMYFNPNAGPYGQPTPENPWFNETDRHPFSVGYDYNHESPHTRQFSKRVMEYWIKEFKIDGYRFDLSKGFTQTYSLGNIALWNQYDQSRINIWLDYSSHIWSVDPTAYVILEHFANNDEETVLANNGMMLWGVLHEAYKQCILGFQSNSNFSWISHQTRGWNFPHLVGYAVSHDEERLMYEALNFGNTSNPNHNVRDLNVALKRSEMIATLLIPIPGPKMWWQFDELGYPYSINYCPNGTINPSCRTDRKPIRWDYIQVTNRARLYKVYAALARLKTQYPAFSTNNFNLDVGGLIKRIFLYHPTMDVVILGNIHVQPISFIPGFNKTGTWYEYFTNTSINVTDLNAQITLQPGEYRIYTTSPLPAPDLSPIIPLSTDEIPPLTQSLDPGLRVYPNPVPATGTSIDFYLHSLDEVSLEIFDVSGRKVATLLNREKLGSGVHLHWWNGKDSHGNEVKPGMYILKLTGQQHSAAFRLNKIN